MRIDGERLKRVFAITVILYFVIFTASWWFLDLAFPGKLATQQRVRLAFDAGNLTGILAFVCSGQLWRSHRCLSIAGFFAILMWLVWVSLPRL